MRLRVASTAAAEKLVNERIPAITSEVTLKSKLCSRKNEINTSAPAVAMTA